MSQIRRGTRQENRVKKALEEQGYLVTRSARSGGDFDLIAIHELKREIRFIQVKYGSKKYLKSQPKLYDHLNWINGSFEASFEMLLISPNESLSL